MGEESREKEGREMWGEERIRKGEGRLSFKGEGMCMKWRVHSNEMVEDGLLMGSYRAKSRPSDSIYAPVGQFTPCGGG